MRRRNIHHIIYIVGLMALVACLPLSHFGIGLCAFIVFLNWIAEWNWKEKWSLLQQNREGLLFAGLFVFCLLGLIRTENWAVAGHNLLSKVPLLIAPLIVITSKPLSKKELYWICLTFVLSTLFCCCYSFLFWLTHTVTDIRRISLFIDHIRFSLCIVLSMVFCLQWIIDIQNPRKLKVVFYAVLLLVLGVYLFIAQTLTGIVILTLILLVYLFYLLGKMPASPKRVVLLSLLSLTLLCGVTYFTIITYHYFHDEDTEIKTTQTAMGNAYTFKEDDLIENGHRIGYYVCRHELEAAWSLRSDSTYDLLLEQTLIRYLNSKGMYKDYAAVMSLTPEEIHHVEQHIANYDYTRAIGLRRALYQTYFSFSVYQKYGYIEGSSLLQRLELWKASCRLIRQNWLLGVGIGDYKEALDAQLQQQHSDIAYKTNRGSHNQFLTFWLMGGVFLVLYFVFVLLYPFVKMRSKVTMLYVALMLILVISMLTEDTLEAQTGRMLYAVFVPLLLFSNATTLKSPD